MPAEYWCPYSTALPRGPVDDVNAGVPPHRVSPYSLRYNLLGSLMCKGGVSPSHKTSFYILSEGWDVFNHTSLHVECSLMKKIFLWEAPILYFIVNFSNFDAVIMQCI